MKNSETFYINSTDHKLYEDFFTCPVPLKVQVQFGAGLNDGDKTMVLPCLRPIHFRVVTNNAIWDFNADMQHASQQALLDHYLISLGVD